MADGTPRLACRPEILALVPEALARETEVFPLDHSGGAIRLAVAAPLSDEVQDLLRFVLKSDIREAIYPIEAIRQAIDHHYGDETESETSIFYYPESAKVFDDGSIEMSVSVYESGKGHSSHLTGWDTISADDPEYELWRWIISQGTRFGDFIGPMHMEAIREEYRRNA